MVTLMEFGVKMSNLIFLDGLFRDFALLELVNDCFLYSYHYYKINQYFFGLFFQVLEHFLRGFH